jgi:hypothetical protein
LITLSEYQLEDEFLFFPIFSAQYFENKGEHSKSLCINAIIKTGEYTIRAPHEKASS